jgi:hypothetical protein
MHLTEEREDGGRHSVLPKSESVSSKISESNPQCEKHFEQLEFELERDEEW